MNLSSNYYNNKTTTSKKVLINMQKEIDLLFEKTINNVKGDGFEFLNNLEIARIEFNNKAIRIIDKYQVELEKESSYSIEQTGETFGFGWDSQFKEHINEVDWQGRQ